MNQNNPLVSVIIPVYNGDRYLKEAIESILAQDYQPIEIIIVDDGSTDNTANIAKNFGDKISYYYQENAGHGQAKNRGLELAKGEFLGFLDSDDLFAKNKLTLQIDYLLKNPDIGFTIGKIHYFLEQGIPQPHWLKQQLLTEDTPGYLVGTLLMRRSILKQVGDFDATYKYGNDSDWFFRAKDLGIAMTILPETILYKRIHNHNQCYQTKAMTKDMLRLIKSSIQRQRQI
jgi:glycosyltransferase involved in cell wall biosynthesis